MEEVYNNLMSNPWVGIGVPSIVFVIALVLLFKRFISFIVTLVLFILAIGSAFAVLDHPAVQEYLGKDVIPGRSFYERLTDSFNCLKGNFWISNDEANSNGAEGKNDTNKI